MIGKIELIEYILPMYIYRFVCIQVYIHTAIYSSFIFGHMCIFIQHYRAFLMNLQFITRKIDSAGKETLLIQLQFIQCES